MCSATRVSFSYGDASVIVSFAGQFTDTIVATGAGGVEIHQLISIGIPVKIQLAKGPVFSVDAGVIVTSLPSKTATCSMNRS